MIAKNLLPTKWGNFDVIAFENSKSSDHPHLAILHEHINVKETVLLRIHSECFTGDLLQSKRCDCGDQFEKSMELIAEQKGMLIYLRQEGRGIGLINKLKAYNLQDEGMDTIEANHQLGFGSDERDYTIAINMLHELKVKEIDLLTNNPKKLEIFQNESIKLNNRIPLITEIKKESEAYMKTKKDHMGHLLE